MTPRLVHPVKIELTLIDPANTPAVDPQFREPVSTPVYLDPIVVTAQLGLGQTDKYQQDPGGDDPRTDGHVVLRVVDWRREGGGRKLVKGARITKLYAGSAQESDAQVVRWVIEEVRPAGHYRQGHTLWLLYYRDMKIASVAS